MDHHCEELKDFNWTIQGLAMDYVKQFCAASGNPLKGRNPENPIPTANGVGGPWKSVEAKLGYLMEDLADTSSTLVATDDSGNFIDIVSGKVTTLEKLTRKLKNFIKTTLLLKQRENKK